MVEPPHYAAPRQGGIVQKLGVEIWVHRSLLVAGIRHLTSVLSPFEAERMAQVKRPNYFRVHDFLPVR
jgi:hypothetical protein